MSAIWFGHAAETNTTVGVKYNYYQFAIHTVPVTLFIRRISVTGCNFIRDHIRIAFKKLQPLCY